MSLRTKKLLQFSGIPGVPVDEEELDSSYDLSSINDTEDIKKVT